MHPSSHWLAARPLLIGMLHMPPLPGSSRFAGSIESISERVLADADSLLSSGFECLMLENFGDLPFFPDAVPNITVAHITAIAERVRTTFPHARLGLNVLRNDGCAALSIAHAVRADFIRVNVLCGARVTDQGLISGIAHDLLRLRANLHAEHIAILADVDVKHSAPLGEREIGGEVQDLIERAGADAVIVSGTATGQPVDIAKLQRVSEVAGSTPVLIGSGATADSIASILKLASGAIVGSSLKFGGRVTDPVDPQRAREFVAAARHLP